MCERAIMPHRPPNCGGIAGRGAGQRCPSRVCPVERCPITGMPVEGAAQREHTDQLCDSTCLRTTPRLASRPLESCWIGVSENPRCVGDDRMGYHGCGDLRLSV